MSAIVLLLGLLTGQVSPEDIEYYGVTERNTTTLVAQADTNDTRTMTDQQIEETYFVPAGWDRAAWIAAVRTVDVRIPAGRR